MTGSPKHKLPIAVLISGRGSNMLSLAEAARAPDCPYEIAIVAANRPDAGGLSAADGLGLRTACIDHKAYSGRETFEQALDGAIREVGAELVVLAGFMRVLTPWFVARWHGRLVNIHPSLLPSFRGVHTHAQALNAGVRVHGCTVHYVVPELDAGPIIAQAAVPVLDEDDEASLAARVLAAEHRLFPKCIAWIASGDVALQDGAVRWSRPAPAQGILFSPDPSPARG